MMGRILLALMVLMVPGCFQTNPPRDPVIQPIESHIGVREQCKVDMPAEPTWQVDSTAKTADDLTRSQAILIELEQRRAWGEKVKAAVKKCE